MSEEFKTCGRLTKAGTPCRNPQGYGWGVDGLPCRTHETQADKDLYRKLRAAYEAGRNAGKESGRSEMRDELVHAARTAEELRNFRTRTPDGKQIVQVKGYSYTWAGLDLEVGDKVLLPAGWSGSPWEGVVEKLGSSYTGEMRSIVMRCKDEEKG